jgi:hypothetical protein
MEELFEKVVRALTEALKAEPERNSGESGSTASWVSTNTTFKVEWARVPDEVTIAITHRTCEQSQNSLLEELLVAALQKRLAPEELAAITVTGSVAAYPISLAQEL